MSNSSSPDSTASFEANPALRKMMLWVLALSQLPMLYLLYNRLFCPFEIDGAQYNLMHMIDRIRLGGSLYVPLAPGQSSPTYTPLYFWSAGYLCRLLGSSVVYPRVLGIIFFFLYAGVVGRFTWKRTNKDLVLSCAAAAFVMATFGFMGGPWFISLNVNTMHAFFAVAGFYLLSDDLSKKRVMWAAVMLVASFYSKQTGLAYVVAAGAMILYRSRQLGGIFAVTSVALLLGIGIPLNKATDGLFYYNAFESASAAPWLLSRVWNEVLFPHLLGHMGVVVIATIILLFLVSAKKDFWDTVWRPEFVMCGAGIGVALIAQPKLGSGALQAVVGYAGLAVCGCIGLSKLMKVLPAGAGIRIVSCLIVLQLATMLLPLTKEYRQMLVDEHDYVKHEQIGEVFRSGLTTMYNYPYLPTMYGQPESGIYGDDKTMWKDGKVDYSARPESMRVPFENQQFDFVILCQYEDQRDPAIDSIVKNYQPVRKIPGHPLGPTGGHMRYEFIVFQAKRLLPAQGQPGGS